MTGPVMIVSAVMTEMVKAASEVMSKTMSGKTVAESVTAESPRYGVGLSQRDSEENRGGDGNGFSQQHRSHR
jgi:hypothetical protein